MPSDSGRPRRAPARTTPQRRCPRRLGAGHAPSPPGEVSAQQLTDAIATTAQNPASFPAYTGDFSDPTTQGEMIDFKAYVESMRQALVR